MKLNEFLEQFQVSQNTNEKPITHTSMNNGKWHIPEKFIQSFYKKIVKYIINTGDNIQLVEKMGDFHPLVIDIDIKYEKEFEERQYNRDTIFEIVSFLWLNLSNLLEIEKEKGEIWIMEKETPYPCKTNKKYKTKDGIHIILPNIIIKKSTYRKIMDILKEEKAIEEIFKNTCINPPSNKEDTLLDGCFSGWQPYGCSKENETYYKLTEVYKIDEDFQPIPISKEAFEESYTNSLTIMKKLSMVGHKEENIEYSEDLKSILNNRLKNTTSNGSSGMVNNLDDIYGLYGDNIQKNAIFKIVGEELSLVKQLTKCLSKERAEEYGKWLAVGMCLHNINSNELIESWKEFSMLYYSYAEGTSKRKCEDKWKSFNRLDGPKLGFGSLKWWAKCDNEEMYNKIMKENLEGKINDSIQAGTEAHFRINEVIHKYYEGQFISVDINEDWYYFNGVRWEKTMKGTKLKEAIHKDIWSIYAWYAQKEKDKGNNIGSEICLDFQKKFLKESYVKTLIGGLSHMFYKKDIMEDFDTNNNLLGFENGIYDLKNNEFREGRPEDNITLSNGIELPINKEDLPIKLNDLVVKISQNTPNYDILNADMNAFISQILPDPEVREYIIRFFSSCLCGENREESFNILTGSGGNGKSKLIELIQLGMGEYACNLPVALLTQKRKASGSASPEMARTRGKRFVVMQEPDVNETLNVGEMKEITGNDKIQARGLYKEPFEFTPQFTLFLMCNQLPMVPSDDDGTWRRLRATPFNSRFVKDKDVDIKLNRYPIDKALKQKLPFWKIPLIIKMLQEWREYDTNGIIVPEAVTEKTRDYRNSNDLVGQWINDCCVEVDNIIDGINEYAPSEFENLYADFKEWSSEQEEKNPPDKKSVKEALKKWQASSKFGLSIGKKKANSGINGYEAKPRFNLKVV